MISSHLLGFALQMLKDRHEKFIDKRHASQMATQRKLHQHEISSMLKSHQVELISKDKELYVSLSQFTAKHNVQIHNSP
jgi:hypothetical protein